jgi:maltooligosyltrehalose trehalohydrolase
MFLSQFRSLATPEYLEILPDPGDERNFKSCKLDFLERQKHAPLYRLFRDLLRLRKKDPVFSTSESVDGAVLSGCAFALRRFAKDGEDRLLLVNLGPDLKPPSIPEPLVAPPSGREWELLWSSEHPDYGGNGTPELETPEYWRLPGQSALVLVPSGKGA